MLLSQHKPLPFPLAEIQAKGLICGSFAFVHCLRII